MGKYPFYIGMGALVVSLAGCMQAQSRAPELLEPVGVKMDLESVIYEDLFSAEVYEGEVVPWVEEISFAVDGRVEEVLVSPGDAVKKGDVLITLDVETAREQIKALETQIEEITKGGEFEDRLLLADIEIAMQELSSMKEAFAAEESCRVKEIEIQTLQTKLRQNQDLRALSLEEKERQLSLCRQEAINNAVTAPFDGQVLYTAVTQPGEAVHGYEPVLWLADESRLFLKTEYLSDQAFESAARVSARIGDQEYGVSYVPYEEEEFFSMLLSGEDLWTKFLVEGDGNDLKSGQYGALLVNRVYLENVLTVPANAVYRENGQSYVYLVEEGQRIRRDVTVGYSTDARVQILEGLQEGEQVYVRE